MFFVVCPLICGHVLAGTFIDELKIPGEVPKISLCGGLDQAVRYLVFEFKQFTKEESPVDGTRELTIACVFLKRGIAIESDAFLATDGLNGLVVGRIGCLAGSVGKSQIE